MKLLLHKALQAVLTADVGQARSTATTEHAPIVGDKSRMIEFSTRLGTINLVTRTAAASRRADRLRKRYAACEREILLMLGHLVVRGRASASAARGLGEKLCGHKLRDRSVRAIVERLNAELDELNRREMQRIRSDEAAMALRLGHNTANVQTELCPSAPAFSSSGFTNRIWNWSPTWTSV